MRWLACLLATACSSAPGAQAPTPPAPAAAPPAQTAPSERECDELVTRAVALGIDERAARSPDPATTPSDHEAVRRTLRDDFAAGCRTLSRDAYRCAMAATTLAALTACQPSPTSSTSNSSVAPGGISPPAPRSP